ncbi:MAG: CoA-binding protein, partial [Planctomycetota bacterium]|nr:CoA-binding protein [Planctomycetota bacterium]
MSILIGRTTRVLVQGITGKQGRKISVEMIDYGTHVVAGVTPGKGGDTVHGLPVYNTVAEALQAHPEINTSLVSVPREGTKAAAMEALACPQVRLVNILTEGLPRRDAAEIVQHARKHGTRVIGPASIGIINPIERAKVGAIGGNDPGVFYPGQIAVFSKIGGMCLSIATEIFNTLGLGTSIVVGIGGDRVTGTSFKDLLELVRDDRDTSLVILNGEVGGDYEEEAARYIKETNYPKRVVARLTGIGAQNIFPRGSRMGHAGAIIGEGRFGSYESKVDAFEKAGVKVAKTSEELIAIVERAVPRRGPDLEVALSKEFELVSISKTKLENLKSQVRAVPLRTHLTHLIDGMPHFRGRPLTQLMRTASVPRMIYEALTKEDADDAHAAQVARDLVLCARTIPPPDAARAAAVASCRGGSPLNAAVSAGLLALPAAGHERLPASLRDRYAPVQVDALVLIPQVVDLVASILGHELHWNDESIESVIFQALAGRKPSAAEANLMRAAFVSCVDHTPATPSSLAAITSYSGGNSLKTALAAGITAMGDTHAGAGEGTARILTGFLAKMRQACAASGAYEADGVRITDVKGLAAYIVDKVTGAYGGEKGRIPGYGHRYYSLYGKDPRAVTLLEMARELGVAGDYCLLASEIEATLKAKKAQGLCFNVDGVIGAVLCDLKMRPETGKAIFIIPRT